MKGRPGGMEMVQSLMACASGDCEACAFREVEENCRPELMKASAQLMDSLIIANGEKDLKLKKLRDLIEKKGRQASEKKR